MRITWYLSDIGRAQGLQELFTRQSPQKLKVLKEHAIAQSVVSRKVKKVIRVPERQLSQRLQG